MTIDFFFLVPRTIIILFVFWTGVFSVDDSDECLLSARIECTNVQPLACNGPSLHIAPLLSLILLFVIHPTENKLITHLFCRINNKHSRKPTFSELFNCIFCSDYVRSSRWNIVLCSAGVNYCNYWSLKEI